MTPKESWGDWPSGVDRVVVDEVGSTLDAAMARDARAPFWLLAHRQTAARGRRGRTWVMPEGNFAATLWMPLEEPPAQRALRSFAMSLALFQALAEITGAVAALTLKWPNDVLLKGGKVAGILLESDAGRGLAIGVGVNLAAAPGPSEVEPGAVAPVSVFGATGLRVDPEAFLTVLARHYAREEARFRAQGFAPLREQWLAHAARLGETLTARLPGREVTGRFDGIDADGNLVLAAPAGTEAIAAADIYF